MFMSFDYNNDAVSEPEIIPNVDAQKTESNHHVVL